ncbi:cell division protein ZapD [Orbaceae bacterium ac157xtp]
MDRINSMIIFEHPLNEKMRTWLRIEFLLTQLEQNKSFNQKNALLFFHLISELLEITERIDLRNDLSKDIEEQKQKLSLYLNVCGVDTEILNNLLNKLNQILNQLGSNPMLGQSLREDRLLSAIRKRIAIPGGCCNFDLPNFYLWLQQEQAYRDHQVDLWLKSFSTLNQAISIYLPLVRQSSDFKRFTFKNNFFQNSNEVINLLRIRLPLNNPIYPQVSGNSSRYAIRFIPLENSSYAINNSEIEFELACC